MIRPRTMLLAVAGWLGVVLAVSVLTWSVIDSAGQDVLGADEPAAVGTTASGTPSTSAPAPSRTPRTDSPRPETPIPTGPAPGTLSADPSTPAPSRTTSPKPAPATQPATRIATWRGSAGTVVVACTGARASLRSATPSDGWRVQVDKRGPEEVEVEFERSGDAEGEAKVEARCRDGVPRFSVETE